MDHIGLINSILLREVTSNYDNVQEVRHGFTQKQQEEIDSSAKSAKTVADGLSRALHHGSESWLDKKWNSLNKWEKAALIGGGVVGAGGLGAAGWYAATRKKKK